MNNIEKICRANPSLTAKEIAEKAGVTRARVYQVLKARGLKPAKADLSATHESRKRPPPGKTMICNRRMTNSFRGDISEVNAAFFLMRKGFYVYRSLSGNAPFDLIAYGMGVTYRVEVKTGGRNADGDLTFNQPANREFDVLAIVEIEAGAVHLRPDITKICPPSQ